jgi:hypothetical protein
VVSEAERERLAVLHAYALDRGDQLGLQRQRADQLPLEETHGQGGGFERKTYTSV